MPYIKQNRSPYYDFEVLIQGTMNVQGVTTEDAGRMMKRSTSTAQRRLRRFGDMTLDELTALGRGLHIPIEQLRDALHY